MATKTKTRTRRKFVKEIIKEAADEHIPLAELSCTKKLKDRISELSEDYLVEARAQKEAEASRKDIGKELIECFEMAGQDKIHIPGIGKATVVKAKRDSISIQGLVQAMVESGVKQHMIDHILNKCVKTSNSTSMRFFPDKKS